MKTYRSQIAFFLLGLIVTLALWRLLIPVGVLLLLYYVFFSLPKLSKLRDGKVDVIKIGKQENYAVPIKVFKEPRRGWMVRSVCPILQNTTVSFVEQSHPLKEVGLVDASKPHTLAYEVSKQVSAPTKELYGELESKLDELQQKIVELERIEALARSSEIYSQQADLYARALRQLHDMVEDGYKLRKKCKAFIRETLIGAEISKLEPTALPDSLGWKIEFQEKYKAISTQYQILNDEIEALVSLRKEADS